MNSNTPDKAELRIKELEYKVTHLTHEVELERERANSYRALFAQQPSSQAMEGYWICTDQLSKGGQKVMGPFVSQDMAFAARTQLEKLNKPVTYWIDRLTEPNETGRKV